MNETVNPTQASEPEPTEPEQTESPDQPRRGRKFGSKNKEKIDYDQRIEDLISAMNDLIMKGELTATIERAYNRQIEYFQFQIQRRDDAKKESRERELAKEELEAQPPVPVPPVPDAKAVESERRVNKMLQQLEDQRERKKSRPEPVPVEPSEPSEPLYVIDPLTGKTRLNVKRTEPTEPKPSAEQIKKAAEELEKRALAEQKAAKIAELKQAREDIYKNMNTPGFHVMAASNPAWGRAPLQGLKEIAAELRLLEDTPVSKAPDQFSAIVEEQREENAKTQREYAREWEWQMSGMQTSPPSGVDLFRRD